MTVNFNLATIKYLALAKVGNPQRGEALKTSKELCAFGQDDEGMLSVAFTKPFRNLDRYRFHHNTGLNLHEMNAHCSTIFDQPERFLACARKIARHLFDKTTHPNIKSGDLCIAYIEGVKVDGESSNAVSIIKSESSFPFLEISDHDGDLRLTTHNGIYPEKVDKGALIIDRGREDGSLLYTFDKAGADTNFWVRDFLGARALKDKQFKTKEYANMCVKFADEGLPGDVPTEDRYRFANDAIQYLSENERFDSNHFQQEVLREPELVENFKRYQASYKDEDGEPLDETFEIDQKQAKRVSSKIRSVLKLDTGVVMKFTPDFAERQSDILERGYDEEMQMNYVKIYYNEEV